MKGNKGFTLLELMLSLAIFVFIGLVTVRMLQQIQVTKTSAFKDMDSLNDIRAALGLLRNDLSQAFHIPFDDMAKTVRAAVQRNEPVAHTLFDGREKELVFTSLSHRNYFADRRESEQTEISYFLFSPERSKTPSLMKRESELIDTDLFQGGPLFRLVDNVTNLKFNYWDEKQEKWVTDWNSDSGSYYDRFPLQVKVEITIDDENSDPITVSSIVKIAFPNNTANLVQF
ncbi:prepilin-type N-terminal cleavage/methylation domain-containing protein [bacterium]|nr:prepilin-type N-terminal cleavage/methylation domain-containing protein [bacterium]